MAKIIEEECVGCGVCERICPEGIEMINGKAKIKNEKANCLKEAANACPRGIILMNDENSEINKNNDDKMNKSSFEFRQGRGMGKGRGTGRGQGRGLGLGPRNGSGRGNRGYCN